MLTKHELQNEVLMTFGHDYCLIKPCRDTPYQIRRSFSDEEKKLKHPCDRAELIFEAKTMRGIQAFLRGANYIKTINN